MRHRSRLSPILQSGHLPHITQLQKSSYSLSSNFDLGHCQMVTLNVKVHCKRFSLQCWWLKNEQVCQCDVGLSGNYHWLRVSLVQVKWLYWVGHCSVVLEQAVVQAWVVELVLVCYGHSRLQIWVFISFHKEVLWPGATGSGSGLFLEGRMLDRIKHALGSLTCNQGSPFKPRLINFQLIFTPTERRQNKIEPIFQGHFSWKPKIERVWERDLSSKLHVLRIPSI